MHLPGHIFEIRHEMSRLMSKPTKWLYAQRRLRSALASAWSDQCLRCALNGKIGTKAFFMRTAKTLIRLGGCQGWPESSLGAHVILLVLSRGGSKWIIKLRLKLLFSLICWNPTILNRISNTTRKWLHFCLWCSTIYLRYLAYLLTNSLRRTIS